MKLLTSVAVVPHRPAVLAAKLFPTADVLSGGRVIAGVGTGWMREEFEALGTPPYEERGAVTDEYLTAWLALWNETAAGAGWQIRQVRQRRVRAEAGGASRICRSGSAAKARRRCGAR